MVKKLKKFSILLCLFLGGCSSKKDVTEYLNVSFSGYDTVGTSYESINSEKLIQDIYGEYTSLNDDQKEEADNLLESLSIKADKSKNLSNGDKISVTVNVKDEKNSKLKGGKKEFVVENLEKPNELSDEEIEKNVVVNFNGSSGNGTVKIDTTFKEPLTDLSFVAEKDGEISNDDVVELSLDDESKDNMIIKGYILSGSGKIKVKASGLEEIASNAKDISNYNDVSQFIAEGINRKYKEGWYKYEVKLEKMMYRQFNNDTDSDSSWYSTSSTDGTLVGVYTVKEYNSSGDKLNKTFTSIYGYTNLILDDEKKVNLADIKEYEKTYDDTYSLDSVIKLMQGYGYEEVK